MPAWASATTHLERDLAQIFVGRSFTIRNFYKGTRLRYDSNGELLGKRERGYWSRDGMVKVSSLKLSSSGELVFQGERYCVLFDPEQGEFSNVRTGDSIELAVQLPSAGVSLQSAIFILYRVFLTTGESLSALLPAYWTDCLSQKVDRHDKHSPWECIARDKQLVPDFAATKIVWEVPPPDTSLHNGMQLYDIRHRVGYASEGGLVAPRLQVAPDPLLQWAQRRTPLGFRTLVFAFTVGEDGKVRDLSIVSPVGMGVDDDVAEALTTWSFKPGERNGKPTSVHARAVFEITPQNARPILPLQP